MKSRRGDLAFGAVSALAGLVITFVPNHSLDFGLLVFMAWAFASAAVAAIFRPRAQRTQLLEGAVSLAAAVLAGLALASNTSTSFPWIAGGWALAFALVTVITHRRLSFVAVASIVFGIAQLAMPINPVVNVGLTGAFQVVMAIWIVIGALSPTTSGHHEGAAERHG